MTSGGSDQEKQRRGIAIRFGIVAAIIGVAALASLPLLSFFDAERISSLIDGAGPWGPIVFILIQIGQVFAAPIPGQITGFVGGFLFGTALGTVYATIGGTIGCSLVFILARRFGRPFVEGFVSTKITDRFDYISDHGGAWVLLLIFVVPIFPDDLICYLSGLTRILLHQLILVALVGRIPGYLLFSLAGAGAAQSNLTLVVVIAAALVVVAGVAFWQRSRIEHFLRRMSAPKEDRASRA